MAAKKRKPTSKRLRFEVFARDGFTCQYCGRTPPAVVLEVDHVVPVAADGKTTEDNLITACEDCNAGKGATPATRPRRPGVPVRSAQIVEAEEQLAAYRESVRAREDRIARDVEEVDEYYHGLTGERWWLAPRARATVRTWLREWSIYDLREAFDIAVGRGVEDFMPYIGAILRNWRQAGRRRRGEGE